MDNISVLLVSVIPNFVVINGYYDIAILCVISENYIRLPSNRLYISISCVEFASPIAYEW